MIKDINAKAKAGILSLLACLAFAYLILSLLSPPKAIPASAPPTSFSAERAMEHLKIIASEPHSLGTLANDKVISYLVQELKTLGLDVHLQDTIVNKSSKNSFSARVSRVKNIIGTLKGTDNSKAILLMAHHDSQPNTPGAADDGSGVVAILETLRAIKAAGSLKNDIIVLLSDGEEIGLMGAKAFVDFHPMLKDIGVIINLEARGNKGVSISFEMNPENGWIVREFAKSAPYPFTNSMAYEIYKVMPNDTDYSEFREKGIAGINSACLEGFVNYHSMTDSPENISLDLIQHHGSNMLGMAKHFGNLTIEATKAPDAIFFNPIGSSLIIYPASYNWIFILLTVILFIAAIIIGLRKEQIILPHIFTGVGYFLVILTIAGVGSVLLLQIITSIHPQYSMFYANNFYNVNYYYLSVVGLVTLGFAGFYGFMPQLNALSLSLGGILMLIMALFGLTISLPTGTYLFYFPLIFYLLVQIGLLLFNIKAEEQPMIYGIGQFLAVIPAIALWVQIIFLLFITFGLTPAIAAPALFIAFLGTLMIPIIRMISLWKKSFLNTCAILTLLAGLILGGFTSTPTKDRPLQTYLMYAINKMEGKAVWATYQKYKNDWIEQIIPTETATPFNQLYPDWDWNIWQENAPFTEKSGSTINVSTDTFITDVKRRIELDVQFESFVNSMEFFVENGEELENIYINNQPIDISKNKKEDSFYINFFAPPMDGFKILLITKNDSLNLRTIDRTLGLPTSLFPSPMPDNMIHGPGRWSNVTLATQSYSF